MKYDDRKVAGALLFLASVQCVFGIIIAEALYPGYSTSQNYISDLGVGPSALIFHSSVFLLGAVVIVDVHLTRHVLGSRLFSALLVLMAVGAMGVGLFPEDFGIIHGVASLFVFLFGALSAIVSYKVQKPPFSYLSLLLGALSLVALLLFISGTYLGLGKGGMERLIAYPALLWCVGFGGYLIGYSRDTTARAAKS
jgi:hypothetical membrane protein